MNIKKELLVIYNDKDEDVFRHIESLIMTNDDADSSIVGVKDDSIIVYKCLVANYKKLKDTADKYLFVDCVPNNSVENQIFNKYGISYGTIDNDHLYIKVNDSYKWDRSSYDSFLCELNILTDDPIAEKDAFKATEEIEKRDNVNKALRLASLAIAPAVGIALHVYDAKNEIQFRKIRRTQSLYYGITKMYMDDMESLLNK